MAGKKKTPRDQLLEQALKAGIALGGAAILGAAKVVENQTKRLMNRERAIDYAKEIEGRFGEVTIGDQKFWVVWKDDTWKKAFPPTNVTLDDELKDHNPEKILKAPDGLIRNRVKSRFPGRRTAE